MTHVTCRLTVKNRDQLRNPALGSRVWATFTSYFLQVRRDGGRAFEISGAAALKLRTPNDVRTNGAVPTQELIGWPCEQAAAENPIWTDSMSP